mgnify:CR=1 FL=1
MILNIYFSYIVKRTFKITASIFFVFIFIDFIFNLLGELEDISTTYTFIEIFKFSLYSSPERAFVFLEGSCLLGFMISMGLSQEEGNLNVLRSSGISPFKIVLIGSIGPMILAVIFLLSHEYIFKDLSNKSEISKELSMSKTFDADADFTWLKDGSRYINFKRKIEDRVFDVRYFEIEKNIVNISLVSDSAKINNNQIIFDSSLDIKINKTKKDSNSFEVIKDFNFPVIVSKNINDIDRLSMRDKSILISQLSGQLIKQDRIFKSHLEKSYLQFFLKPISIISLILFFGCFIFGSLRESTSGSKIVISVLGAFIYQISQDLSSSIAISFNFNILFGSLLPALIIFFISLRMYRKLN